MAKIKTTGAELKKFWTCEDKQFWPDDAHVEDVYYEVNGVVMERIDPTVDLKDDDQVVVEGYIFLNDGEKDIAGVMRKWRKIQSHASYLVEIPTEHKEALDAFLKTIKGKIL